VKKLVLLGTLALLLGASMLILLVRQDVEARVGEEQLYDDFGFSVLSAQRSGGRCAVELRIVNHARRVPYRLDGFHVRLVDAQGGEHEELRGEAVKPRTEIAAGESVVETHVFELPEKSQGVVLELNFGRIPDALDWLFLGKRTYALP